MYWFGEITDGERLTLTLWFTRKSSQDEDAKLITLLSERFSNHQDGGTDSYLPYPAPDNMYWFSHNQSGFDVRRARVHILGYHFCSPDDSVCNNSSSGMQVDPLEQLSMPLRLGRGDKIFDKEFANSLHALQVIVVTTHEGVPQEFYGAKLIGSWRHNFYVFPRKELPIDGPSYEFLCQTTSIDFLTKYQFDFNAWIYEGISYLSRAQEVEAICALSSAYDNILVSSPIDSRESVDIPIVSTADVLFLERMKNRFHEWRIRILKDPSEDSLRGNCDSSKPQFQTSSSDFCFVSSIHHF